MINSPLQVAIPNIEELQTQCARLLAQSLAQAVQAADPQSLSPRDLELARSNFAALSFAQAVGLHGAYRYLRDFIARQAIPIKSSGEFLDGWLLSYGMQRKSAQAALGTAQGTGVAGSLLGAGTLLQSSSGQQYQVVSGGVVDGLGNVSVSLVATLAGSAGNEAAGAALSLVSAVSGINSGFIVAAAGIGGGADVETDDEAVYRLQQRLANQPLGGAPADYARWALTVAGITRAWGIRNPLGPCTAGVVIMADNNAGGLPSAAQAQAVFDYITDPMRGPPDDLYVITPTPISVDLTIRLLPDSADARLAVSAELKNLFYREAYPGGQIPHTHLIEAVSVAAGEYNHEFVSPVLTVGGFLATAGYQDVLTLGTVTFLP